MMRLVRALLRIALPAALVVAPAPAAAQTDPEIEELRSRARFRAGALHITPRFTLERLGIDTNVFNSRSRPEQDFVIAATPEIDFGLPVGRGTLFAVRTAARAEYFRRFAGERSLNPEVDSTIRTAVGRLTFFADTRYLDTRQRPTYEIDLRARRVETEVTGGIRIVVAPKLRIDLEGTRERLRFDADAFYDGMSLAEQLNREERAGRIVARWRRTALSTFLLDAEFRSLRFSAAPDRDSDNVVVALGGEFHPRALVSGAGRIGMRWFDGLGAAVNDVARVVAGADLTVRLPAGVTGAVEAERDIEYSFSALDPYYVITRYGFSLTRRIAGPVEITGRIVRDTYDYVGATGRRDVGQDVAGTLAWSLNETTRVGFRFGEVTRRSTVDRWRFRGLQAGLVFEYGV